MANLRYLVKDTAIYGLSSIVGRFLNYLLVPLYTHCMPRESGDYGISTNMYAYVALILVILTFGMETTLFRFANQTNDPSSTALKGLNRGNRLPLGWRNDHSSADNPDTVFSTSLFMVGALTALFFALVAVFIDPIGSALGYAGHHDYLLMMAAVVSLDALQAVPFSYLRFLRRPVLFASLKLLFIVLNISLNCIFFLLLGKTQVVYIFRINLWCTGIVTFFFIPLLLRVRWHVSLRLLRRMLASRGPCSSWA